MAYSRMMIVLCGGLLLAGGCASQSDLQEAKDNQLQLSTQLEQVSRDRDHWQKRSEKLQTQARELQAQISTLEGQTKDLQAQASENEKKIAQRDQQLAARKKEAESLQAKLTDATEQLAKARIDLE